MLDKSSDTGPAKWRVHFDIILDSYESKLRTLLPTFEFKGTTKIITCETTDMTYITEHYLKVFPNLNEQTDLYVIKGEGHRVGVENPKALSDAINLLYSQIDNKWIDLFFICSI